MSIEEKLDRIVMAIERLAEKWAPPDSRRPLDPCGLFPSPTLPPITTVPTPVFPPTPTGTPMDDPNFNWDTPGSYRRFIGQQTKYLPVPSYQGTVGLFISASTGNTADFVQITVTDGPKIIVSEKVNTSGYMLPFFADGPKTYAISCDTPGAVITINFLIGG